MRKEVLLSHKLQDLVLVKPRSSASASKIPVYKHIPSDPARFCVSTEQLNWGEGGGKILLVFIVHFEVYESILSGQC